MDLYRVYVLLTHINETWHIKITQQDRWARVFTSVLCVLQGWFTYIHYTSKLNLSLHENSTHCIFKHLFQSSSMSDLVVFKKEALVLLPV